MKIQSYQPIKYNPINFQARNNKSFSLKQLTRDVFQRTFPTKKAESAYLGLNEKDIMEIYDEVFEKTLKHNPIAKELNFEKPKLAFVDLGNSDACYDFFSNTINIGSKYKEEHFAYQAFDEKGMLINTSVISKNYLDSSLDLIKQISSDFQVYKLNPQEQRLYLKSVLAHELRHWVQEHVLASTMGCEEHYDYRVNLINQMISSLEELVECAKQVKSKKKDVKTYEERLAKAKKDYSYILNFKANRVLDENYNFKTSFTSFEDRYWSVKNHLLPASIKYKNSDDNEYAQNPIEIDAFYYQGEFLMEEKTSRNIKGVRQEVFEAMLLSNAAKGYVKLENIEDYGYPPLIVEN